MRILMLGNSYIFTNDLPSMLAEITGAEVVQNTRGGARLREQLNPETRLGAKALELLQNEKWDYVVLQEMSNGPITAKESFMQSVKDLCGKIRETVPYRFCMRHGHTKKTANSFKNSAWITMRCTAKCTKPMQKRQRKTTHCSPMSAVHFMKKPKPIIYSTTTEAIRTKRARTLPPKRLPKSF